MLDERKIRIYTYLIKVGIKTIDQIPTEYQGELAPKLARQ